MAKNLRRRYETGNLHFVTFSCYRRLPLLKTARARNVFLIVPAEVRTRYQFAVIGYVVMPEHVHLLLSDPAKRDPSIVVQVLKQRVSRRLRRRIRARTSTQQLHLWHESTTVAHCSFWQRRFYDFNVWSRKKRSDALRLTIEKNKVNGCRSSRQTTSGRKNRGRAALQGRNALQKRKRACRMPAVRTPTATGATKAIANPSAAARTISSRWERKPYGSSLGMTGRGKG